MREQNEFNSNCAASPGSLVFPAHQLRKKTACAALCCPIPSAFAKSTVLTRGVSSKPNPSARQWPQKAQRPDCRRLPILTGSASSALSGYETCLRGSGRAACKIYPANLAQFSWDRFNFLGKMIGECSLRGRLIYPQICIVCLST